MGAAMRRTTATLGEIEVWLRDRLRARPFYSRLKSLALLPTVSRACGWQANIEGDFSADLAALGDRIADTVAVALDPVTPPASFYKKSLRVIVDGEEVKADPENGYVYDELTHSIRFQGASKKKAFAAKIDISYEEHL